MSVELAAVLITGFVALATILIAPVIRLSTDWLAWKRKQKEKRLQKVGEVTKTLLDKLSRVHAVVNFTGAKAQKSFEAETISAFLSWERALWGKSKKDERTRIEALRETITHGNVNTYLGKFDHIVQEILDLTHNVTQRMD